MPARPKFRPDTNPAKLVGLTALLAAVALISLQRKSYVLGADLWWHLKVGDWIVLHRAFPHTGILSRTAADRPWTAYSWAYEVLLSRAYAWLGFVGMGIFGTALTVMVAFSVYWMARRLSGRFWLSCLLTVVGCYSFLLLRIVPRPGFFSMALFCVLLTLVMEARRTGEVQKLYWLPLVFLLWANLHIQFVYGLAVLGLLITVNLAERRLPVSRLAMVSALCVLATVVGPYSYHLYEVVFRYSQAKVPYAMVQELQPFRLRMPANYVELALAAAAFVVVGWGKKIDFFKLFLLAGASILAYRTMRDAWVLSIAAAACIADSVLVQEKADRRETSLQLAGFLAAVVVIAAVGARSVGFNQRNLQRAVSDFFPVDAADFVRQHNLSGLLWNPFDWGGFLSWYLPQYPVAIDSRTELYGDEMLKRFYDTENGDPAYRGDPYLNESGVVLLRSRDALVPLLDADPRFDRVYRDDLATVFVRVGNLK